MTLTLYQNLSENNRLNKALTQIGESLTGTLRAETSIFTPDILIDLNAAGISAEQITTANYAYVPEFNRYYFITDMTMVRQDLVRLSMRCDVLQSFSSQILEQTAIVRRQENNWNLNLDDGLFTVYQNPIIRVQTFPQGFTSQSFILSVAGSNS